MKLADNNELRETLIKRLIELDLLTKSNERFSYKKVTEDALERGMNGITTFKFSRYLQAKDNSLGNREIIWLCLRYCIFLDPAIVSYFRDNTINAYPVPYSDFAAVESINNFK
jgi:hypothetical protein